MDKFYELYKHDGYELIITTTAAGRMGSSWELANENRKKVLSAKITETRNIYFVRQFHSRDAVTTSEHCFFPLTMADGIVTDSSYAALAVTVGDCMPILLYDRKNKTRALLHSGWKGTGIALNALKKMKALFGADSQDVTAFLGPAIGSCCYNVDEHRAELFASEWGRDAVEHRHGNPFLSLETANREMLLQAGVSEVISSGICTCCDSRFGSFRREGPEKFSQMVVLSYLNQP